MNGVDYSLRSVHFKYTARPNISHIHPQSGPIRGGTRITLYGNHFSSTYSLSCRFNEVIVTAVFFSKNILVCISPKIESPQQVKLSVSDNGKDVSNSIKFSFYNEPTLMEVVPTFGSLEGGTMVRVTALGVENFQNILCKFGESVVSGLYDTRGSTIACRTPPTMKEVVVDISFSLNGGVDFGPSSKRFQYLNAARINHITPKVGPLGGGTIVFINGRNFVNTTKLACKFGDIVVPANFVTRVLVKCPAPKANITGPVSLKVSTNGIDFIYSAVQYFYVKHVGATSLYPSSGPQSGGTRITFSGSNFRQTDSLSCKFDISEKVVPATWISDQSLFCISPQSLSATGTRIRLTGNAVDYTNETLSYQYFQDPHCLDVNILNGPVNGNTEISFRNGFHQLNEFIV